MCTGHIVRSLGAQAPAAIEVCVQARQGRRLVLGRHSALLGAVCGGLPRTRRICVALALAPAWTPPSTSTACAYGLPRAPSHRPLLLTGAVRGVVLGLYGREYGARLVCVGGRARRVSGWASRLDAPGAHDARWSSRLYRAIHLPLAPAILAAITAAGAAASRGTGAPTTAAVRLWRAFGLAGAGRLQSSGHTAATVLHHGGRWTACAAGTLPAPPRPQRRRLWRQYGPWNDLREWREGRRG